MDLLTKFTEEKVLKAHQKVMKTRLEQMYIEHKSNTLIQAAKQHSQQPCKNTSPARSHFPPPLPPSS